MPLSFGTFGRTFVTLKNLTGSIKRIYRLALTTVIPPISTLAGLPVDAQNEEECVSQFGDDDAGYRHTGVSRRPHGQHHAADPRIVRAADHLFRPFRT